MMKTMTVAIQLTFLSLSLFLIFSLSPPPPVRFISVPKNASKELKRIQLRMHRIDADGRRASDSGQFEAVWKANISHRR